MLPLSSINRIAVGPIDLPPHSMTDEEIQLHQFLEDIGVMQLHSEEFSFQPEGSYTEHPSRTERISSTLQFFAGRANNAPVDSPAVANLASPLSSFTSGDALEESFKLIQSNMPATHGCVHRKALDSILTIIEIATPSKVSPINTSGG
eukprot:scaffold435_cov107-Cylindrotheca_fusiformis.AAC.3